MFFVVGFGNFAKKLNSKKYREIPAEKHRSMLPMVLKCKINIPVSTFSFASLSIRKM
jgi:hypothetical protein